MVVQNGRRPLPLREQGKDCICLKIATPVIANRGFVGNQLETLEESVRPRPPSAVIAAAVDSHAVEPGDGVFVGGYLLPVQIELEKCLLRSVCSGFSIEGHQCEGAQKRAGVSSNELDEAGILACPVRRKRRFHGLVRLTPDDYAQPPAYVGPRPSASVPLPS